jgi:hypothetical protein
MQKVFFSFLLCCVFFSCSKQAVEPTVSITTPSTPVIKNPDPVIKNPDPVFKNYFQASYYLKKSDVWPDFYKIASSNGINIQNLFYDCPQVLADFNGDGYDDLLMAPGVYPNEDKRRPLELYINDKTNNKFTIDNSLLKVNLGTNNARKGVVGDFNKDGKPDVVYSESGVDSPPFNGAEQSILLSSPEGYIQKIFPNSKFFSHGVCSGDYDNDGDLDLFFISLTSPTDMFYINDGKGNFTLNNSIIDIKSNGLAASEFYDINKDGFLDLILGGANFTSDPTLTPARILLGNGKDFTDKRSILIPSLFSWDNNLDFCFEDLDNDKVEEIIVLKTQDPNTKAYEGYRVQILKSINGKYEDITSKIMTSFYSETIKWIVWLRVEDIDKNGKLDIFDSDKGHYNTGQSIRWEQDLDGIFRKKSN